MKLVTIFFGFGFLFLSGIFFVPEVQAQTCSGGNCVSDPAACSGSWNIDDNCPSRYCCQGNTTPTGNAGALCTASDDGSEGTCAAQLSCPTGTSVHRSADCLSATPDCCVRGGGSSGSCPDTAGHCKSNCTDYGGIKSGCDTACSAGTGNYYYCVSTTPNTGGQCPSLSTYCHSDCTNYGGVNTSCSGACSGSSATNGLTYCKSSTTTGGGGSGGMDTSGGWTAGFQNVKDQSELPNATIRQIVSGFMMWLLAILGFIAIIAFIVSGLLYLTAAGNDGQIKTAKAAMTWSIVGVIVALVGYVIILAADFLLSGS